MATAEKPFESPFLKDKTKFLSNDVGFVIYDKFPVSKGHSLIVPHRVYSDYFESTHEEVVGLHNLVLETKKIINREYNPDGFNVGINCGVLAGQTVPHVHIHLIPRYAGDMENPRGGVRGVIPSKQKY